MKLFKYAFLTATAVFTSSIALAGDPKFEPQIGPGQCYGDVFSKQYLDSKSTADTVFFVCKYNCMDNQGNKTTIKAESSVSRRASETDGSVMVCDGAVVVQKQMGGNIIWDFDHVEPFWASGSSKPEIKSWVRSNEVQIPEPQRSELIKKFRSTLLQVAIAYVQVPSANFKEAGEALLEIATATEKGNKALEEAINLLSENPKAFYGDYSAKGLILNSVAVHGTFLLL